MSGPAVIVIPAHDEADRIEATLDGLVGRGMRVLVIDDGSSDGTADRARRSGAEVIELSRNLGKAGAVTVGVRACPDAGAFLLLDADLGETSTEGLALLDRLGEGDVDLVVGVPVAAGGRGGFGLVRDLAARAIESATGRRPVAPLSGQRSVTGDLMRSLELAPRFGMETAMTLDALSTGARLVEIELALDHRHHGRTVGGFRHRAGQGVDIVMALAARLGWTRTLVIVGRSLGDRVRRARRQASAQR